MDETENFKNIFGPKKDYPYFNQAEAHPFRPKSTTFEMANAAWCADASLLVYVNDEDFVKKPLKEKAKLDAECVGFDGDRAQYFIAHNKDFIIVSFRGTEITAIKDVMDDALWYLSKSDQGGQVHTGFKNSLDSVWTELYKRLIELSTNNQPVWFTGHSLGGGLATLAADRWNLPSRKAGLYTFGCPRVGDQAFKDDFNARAYRFVHKNDIVTRVPPPGLYCHVGHVYHINSEDKIDDNPSSCDRVTDYFNSKFKSFLTTANKWQEGHLDHVALDDLKDHGPIYYAEKIWAQLQGKK